MDTHVQLWYVVNESERVDKYILTDSEPSKNTNQIFFKFICFFVR